MMGEEVRASSDGIGILPSRKPWVSTMADAAASPRVIAVGFGVAQNLTTFPISSPPTNELRVQRPTVLTGGRDPCPPPVLLLVCGVLLGSVHAARGQRPPEPVMFLVLPAPPYWRRSLTTSCGRSAATFAAAS